MFCLGVVFRFETVSHVSQAGLKLAEDDLKLPILYLKIAGIAKVVPTTRGFMQCRAWTPGPPACQASIPLLT